MTDQNTQTYGAGPYVARALDWLDSRPGITRRAFAFLLGLLLSRTFSPVNAFPLLFVVIPFMILLIDRARNGRDAFAQGWWVGFGLFVMGMNWVGYSFTQQSAIPASLGPVAVIIMAAVLALYIAVTFWVAWRLWPKGPARILYFAAVWTLMEVARGTWFTGLPWLLVGSAWSDWLPVAQSVLWLSVYGLTFLTMLTAGSLVVLIDKGTGWRRFGWAVGGTLLMAAVALAGFIRLEEGKTHYHIGLSMRLVQANVPQKEKWVTRLIDDHFEQYMKLSRQGDAHGRAHGIRLLIWPETAVQREDFDREGSLLRWQVSRLLEYGAFAITGAPRYERKADGLHFYNSLFAINSQADLFARYDKVKLVPFGEYIPFESFFKKLGLEQLVGGSAFTSGERHQVIHLPGIPTFSPLICYEVIFPGHAFPPGQRPDWLLNITNDGWFGMTEGPHQHLALARLRAIEEGLPLVRSAGTGISAVIDPYGRIINQMGLGRKGVLESPLPRPNPAPMIPSALRIMLTLILSAVIIMVRMWRHTIPGTSADQDSKDAEEAK